MINDGWPEWPEKDYLEIFKNLLVVGNEREVKFIVGQYIKYGYEMPHIWYKKAILEVKDLLENVRDFS